MPTEKMLSVMGGNLERDKDRIGSGQNGGFAPHVNAWESERTHSLALQTHSQTSNEAHMTRSLSGARISRLDWLSPECLPSLPSYDGAIIRHLRFSGDLEGVSYPIAPENEARL